MVANFHFLGIFPCSNILFMIWDNPLERMSLAAFIAQIGKSLIPDDVLFGSIVMRFLISAGVTGGRVSDISGASIFGWT